MRKKKLLSLLLTFAMMTWLMPTKIFGTETPELNLFVTPSTTTASPGDEITFTLKMGEVENFTNIDFKVQASEGLTLKDNSNKINRDFKEAMGEEGSASLKVNNGVPKLTAYAETTYSNNEETDLGTLTYTVTGNVNSTATITLIDVAANAGETELTPNLTGATVTITAAPVDLESITITPANVSLTVGDTQELTATPNEGADIGTVTWSASPAGKVSFSTETGATTTITGLDVCDSVTITATSGSVSGNCTISVVACTHENKNLINGYGEYVAPTCEDAGHYKCYLCSDCGKYIVYDENDEVKAVKDSEEEATAAATISAPGHAWPNTYAYDDDDHWRVCTRDSSHEEKGAHNFGAATYTWTEDNKCTASHTCTVCNKTVSETVTATSQDIAATCTEAGKTRYTATFTKAGFTAQTNEVSNGQPAEHDWGAVAYSWSPDYSTCTATRSCKREGCNETQTETATASVTDTATCTEAGTKTFTATFTDSAFENQTKNVASDPLGHNYVEEIIQAGDKDHLGIKKNVCSRCHTAEPGSEKYYVAEGTAPSKYPDGTAISVNATEQASAVTTLKGKDIEFTLEDPLGTLDEGFTIRIENISDDLGANFDGNYSVARAYKANVVLRDEQGQQISGELEGKIRLLLEVPKELWDEDDLQVLRINPGEDTQYDETIEYRVYNSNGEFIKVVNKDYQPQAGETVRKFIAIWTDHFSDYAIIDPVNETSGEQEGNLTVSDIKDNVGKAALKTGQTLMEVYFVGTAFSLSIIAIYWALKKKKEFRIK